MLNNVNKQIFLTRHVEIMRASYRRWTGKELIDEHIDRESAAEALFIAPFAVVSHDTQSEPVFNYANQLALSLFEMDWDEFTSLPSRLSAEAPNQAERCRLLEAVTREGYIDNYSGVRIAKSGKRFTINNATIWNLLTPEGRHYGQAALIRQWMAL